MTHEARTPRPSGSGKRSAGRRSAGERLATVRRLSLLRLRIGFLVVAMLVSVFAARLFQLQGVDAATYVQRARAVGVVTEVLPARRGTITDRNGVPLAESLDGLMIVADPTKTAKDAGAIARILANRLGADYFYLLEQLQTPDTHFRYLVRRIPSTLATAVVSQLKDEGFHGIDVRPDPVRSYPAGDVAANLVGYLGETESTTDGALVGVEGAEDLFDALLSGEDGSATYDQGGGNRVPLGDNSLTEPRDGDDLALTIDHDLQWYVQRVLRATVENAGGESGIAVVMDSRTGELLSLADYPSFDPNQLDQSRKGDRGAASLREPYEPGSVEKVVTLASLLDAGLVRPLTRLVVPEELPSSDRMIHDHFEHGRIRLTLAGVLAKSSNIGTVLAAREMKAKRFAAYLRSFGLGRLTKLGVKGESAGAVSDHREWIDIERDNIAFGQGLSVTAVQMAAAVNVIANNGVYVDPSLVKGEATLTDGTRVGSATAQRRRVVSERAAAQTTAMMEMVTDPDEGTAPLAAVNGYRTAGKTGTAQRVDPACGCYGDSFTVSFAGFAPADDPRFTVYVVVHGPTNGAGGGATGGPAFHRIMTYLLQHYGVPPTGSTTRRLPLEWTPSATAEDRVATTVRSGATSGRQRSPGAE